MSDLSQVGNSTIQANKSIKSNKFNESLINIGDNYLSKEKCSHLFKNTLRGDGSVSFVYFNNLDSPSRA